MYPFYSNCLIEAIKHKMINWNGVEIKKVKGAFHYYWIEDGRAYEFQSIHYPTFPVFLGYISRRINYNG